MAKEYFPKEIATRGKTTFNFDPDEVQLIVDPADSLFDPRALVAPDDELIADIVDRGVDSPPKVVRRDGKPWVVFGRRRILAAREAKRIRIERRLDPKDDPLTVACLVADGDEAQLMEMMVAENMQRKDYSPIEKAKMAARLYEMTKDKKRTARRCAVSVKTLEDWLDLLQLSAPVKKAVERGEITATAVRELKDKDATEQVEILEKLKAQPAGKGRRNGKPTAKEVAKAAGKEVPRMRSRKQIEKRLGEKNLPVDYRHALKWVLGA